MWEIAWIEDRDENKISFTYDVVLVRGAPADRLKTVKDEATGRQFNFIYEAFPNEMRVIEVRYPYGIGVAGNESWHLTYDTEGRLSRVDMPEGQVETFGYTDPKAADPSSPAWARAERLTNMTLSQDARGVGRLNAYGSQEDVVTGTGSLKGTMAQGRQEEQLGEKEYLTSYWSYSGGVPVSRRAYLRKGGIPAVGETTRTGQANGYGVVSVTEEWADAAGTATLQWAGPSVTGFSRTSRYDYGWDYKSLLGEGGTIQSNLSTDLLTCSEDILGRKTYYVYWDGNHPKKQGFLRKAKGPDGIISSYDYNDMAEPTSVAVDCGPGGFNLVSSFAYDAKGRLTRATAPVGDGVAQTQYQYDSHGDLTKVIDPKIRETVVSYDPVARDLTGVSRAVTLVPGEAPVTLSAQFTYDGLGRRTRAIDPEGRAVDFVFDAANRVTRTTLPDPDGANGLPAPVVAYGFDLSGNMTRVTNPVGDFVGYVYGDDNELLSVTVPIDAGSFATTSYAYNDQLELTSVTDARGNSTLYTYDNLGRMKSVKDALQAETNYAFDIADRLTQRTDARGLKTRYAYQSNTDRLERTEYLDATGAVTEALVNQFDRLGRRTSVLLDKDGALTEVEAVEYDRTGRPKRVENCCGNAHEYDFDVVGNRTGQRFYRTWAGAGTPATWQVGYTFDELDRLTSMTRTEAGQAQQVDYRYNRAGSLMSQTYPNGCKVEYTFDGLDRVKTVSNKDPYGAVFLGFEYGYDAAGRQDPDQEGRPEHRDHADHRHPVRLQQGRMAHPRDPEGWRWQPGLGGPIHLRPRRQPPPEIPRGSRHHQSHQL